MEFCAENSIRFMDNEMAMRSEDANRHEMQLECAGVSLLV